MQRAEKLFSVIAEKAKSSPHFRFRRLYRNLFQPSYYLDLDPSLSGNILWIEKMCELLATERYNPRKAMESSEGKQFQLLLEKMIRTLLRAMYPDRTSQKRVPSFEKAVQTFLQHAKKGKWLLHGKIPAFQFAPFWMEKVEDGRWWRLLKWCYQAKRLRGILHQIYQQELELQATRISQQYQLAYLHFKDQFFFFAKNDFPLQEWEERWHSIVQSYIDWEKKDLTSSKGMFFSYQWCYHPKLHKLQLLVPSQALVENIRTFHQGGKPKAVTSRLHLPVRKIIRLYRDEYWQFYKRYRFASNKKKAIHTFRYYHFQSLLKTLAQKEKVSVKVIRRRYRDLWKSYGE